MTAAHDPHRPGHLDEAAVRDEATRVFDICFECRRCVDLCPVFPTLFELIERSVPAEAGSLTPAEQDHVVDACFGCDRCVADCPYAPDLDERAIDVGRLTVRMDAMRQANGHVPVVQRVLNRVAARPMLLDAVAGRERAPWRAAVSAVATGRAGRRRVGRSARRFSTWFGGPGRPTPATTPAMTSGTSSSAGSTARRLVYPTCAVEELDARAGQDLVRLLERCDVECSIPDVGCCGAPWLFAGDIVRFRSIAAANVGTLARDLHGGGKVVAIEPMCADVIRRHYVGHVDPELRGAAELVAERTVDASSDLLALRRAAGTDDTGPDGDRPPDPIVLHAGCHSRTREVVDLLRRTGADVEIVDSCCGAPGIGGVRAASRPATDADELLARLERALAEASDRARLAGECSSACGAIERGLGRRPEHPISIVARRDGVPAVEH